MASAISASRAWNIALRTAHIGTTGMLLGGHFFDVPASRLLPILYLAIVTGAVLGIIELYPDWRGLSEIRSIVIAAKLLLLCCVPWLWDYRVAILIVVLITASACSHMPRHLRHLSVFRSQIVKATPDSGPPPEGRYYMPLSARNRLPGVVQEVQLGTVMARVVVKVGENMVESVITRASAEELSLKKDDAVRVVIKSTEVMIDKS